MLFFAATVAVAIFVDAVIAAAAAAIPVAAVNNRAPWHQECAIATASTQAHLWVRKDEEITFHIKFAKGSHVKVTWDITAPTEVPEVNDTCETVNHAAPAGSYGSVSYADDTGSPCVFPFRLNDELYYGCTKMTNGDKVRRRWWNYYFSGFF